MSKKNLYKISALLCMTLMLGAFTHCVSESPTNKASTSNSSRSPTSDTPSTSGGTSGGGQPTGVAAVQTATGVKNHEQILYTMEALTGIPASTAAIRTAYNQVAVTLPTTNEVKSLLAPNQVAIVKLGAEFCNQLIEGTSQATGRQVIFEQMIQNGPATIAFGTVNLATLTTNKASLIARLVDNFWGGMISEEDLAAAEDELSSLFDEMAMGLANNNASAKLVGKGVCTAVLSSAYVTLL